MDSGEVGYAASVVEENLCGCFVVLILFWNPL